MPFLRQSTAQTFRFGPFLDATDGVTEEVGLTITPALRRLSKDGGAFGAASGAVNATHDSDGWYSASLTTTDTDTVGELILNVQVPATHLPVWMRWWVLEEAIYDALYGAAAAGFDATGQVTVGTNNDKTGYGLGNVAHGGVGSVLTLERLIVASTTATEPAVKLTGNTTGAGLLATGGATSGAGLAATGGAPNGSGLKGAGSGSGHGIQGNGGATGSGLLGVGGSSSGDGIRGLVTSGNEFSGSLSGSVGSIATGGVIDGAIAAAELLNIADACLDRRLDLGTDTGGDTPTSRTWRDALRYLRNRADVVAGVLTVYEEDDTTAAFTAAISTAAGDPITQVNPT